MTMVASATIIDPNMGVLPSWMVELPVMTDRQRQVESVLRLRIGIEARRLWRPSPTERQIASYSHQVSVRCRRTAMACDLGAAGWLRMLYAHLMRLRQCRIPAEVQSAVEVLAA
jgi:hypothetical protein